MYRQKTIQFVLIFIILSLLFWPIYVMGQTAVSPTIGPTSINVTTSDATGIQFTLNTAPFRQEADGSITVADLPNLLATAGAPALPHYSTLLILPPQAEAIITVVETAVSRQNVATIPPVPQPSFADTELIDDGFSAYALADAAGTVVGYAPPTLVAIPDTAVYSQNSLYPQTLYQLSEPSYLRDVRVVELHLYPLRYNPATGQLQQAQQIQVNISFVGSNFSQLRPSPSHQNSLQQSLATQALNYQQAQHWRSLPQSLQTTGTTIPLPTTTPVYKIQINQDGLYELSGADFAAAGMDIANVNPNSLQMLYRGQSVAYQLIDSNGDNSFDANEKLRFYGWDFASSRMEEQFVTNNVLWVWANGTPTYTAQRPNETNMGHPIATNYQAQITRQPENNFFATWMIWDGFPNEPDAWFWDYIAKAFPTITRTYDIELYHPATSGPDATYIMEFNSRTALTTQPHIVRSRFNSHPDMAQISWMEPHAYARTNINLVDNVPLSALNHGINTVTTGYATAVPDRLYLNRITVEYLRQLMAINNELAFQDSNGGSREFHVSGFSEGNVNNVLVWDISVPTSTVAIQMGSGDIVPDGGSFTYRIGSSHAPEARFLVTTAVNTLTAADLAAPISQYLPPNLDAPAGAEWLAISHSQFLAQAQQLGNHRNDSQFGGLLTHTVNINDIINQYGYGLPLPSAVQNFLRHTLLTWPIAPTYVTLVGDATQNPRNLDCLAGCSNWSASEVNYVLTDLPFVDRFQGLIPSDYTFALLSGDDLLADMAIGRLPVQTAEQATALVAKIITFETNQLDPQQQSWQNNFLFVADNYDPAAGNFCAANAATGAILPSFLEQTHLCLPGVDGINPPTPTQVAAIRQAMTETVNLTGTVILNFRGHGAVNQWTGDGFLSATMGDVWQNSGRPFTIFSADCLDGHFAWPGFQGLGESFMKLDDRGTVAHWASSGLGYTAEHSVLQQAFYEAIFTYGFSALGQMINYAKIFYLTNGNHPSEAYSFNLLGDPAMQFLRPDLTLSKETLQPEVDPGEMVDFVLTVGNVGPFPALATVVDTLPPELSFVAATASQPTYAPVISGNQVTIGFISPIALNQSAQITLTATTITDFVGLTTNVATAVAMSGLEADPSNNSATAVITSTVPSVILSAYTAQALDNAVQLDWSISQEFNIVGYKVTRSEEGGPFIWLQNLGENGIVPAQGNTPVDYLAIDGTAQNGRSYRYRLLALQSNNAEVDLGLRQLFLPPYASQLAFNATPLNSEVSLDWQVSAEHDLTAYSLERGQDGNFIWLQGLGNNGYIPATGNESLPATYLVTDTTAVNGQTYTYRLLLHENPTAGMRTAVVATRTVTLMDINLVSFTATGLDNAAQLQWSTLSEINIAAFRLERGQNGNYIWLQQLGVNGYISAVGGPSTAANYEMIDETAVNGQSYDYRLIAVQQQPNTIERQLAADSVTLHTIPTLYLPFIIRP